jgi:hypothetical protein
MREEGQGQMLEKTMKALANIFMCVDKSNQSQQTNEEQQQSAIYSEHSRKTCRFFPFSFSFC